MFRERERVFRVWFMATSKTCIPKRSAEQSYSMVANMKFLQIFQKKREPRVPELSIPYSSVQ